MTSIQQGRLTVIATVAGYPPYREQSRPTSEDKYMAGVRMGGRALGQMGTFDVIVLVLASMVSKLVFFAWAVYWLHRKAIKDEAWEHENDWDNGWRDSTPEADWDNVLLEIERERLEAERRGRDRP